jgi:hypothetical protein
MRSTAKHSDVIIFDVSARIEVGIDLKTTFPTEEARLGLPVATIHISTNRTLLRGIARINIHDLLSSEQRSLNLLDYFV